jgi:hypothetical protein
MSDKFEPVSFTVEDADGNSHTYICIRHNGANGIPVALKLGAVVIRPLVAAFGAVLKSGKLSDLAAGNVDLERFDADSIGAALEGVLGSKDAFGLISQVMANTTRDGKKIEKTGLDAYAGNYFDLLMALKEVVRINGFLPLPGISTILGKVRATLASSGSGSAPGTEASTPS